MQYLVFEGRSYKDAMNQMYAHGVEKNILDQMFVVRKQEDEKRTLFGLRKNKKCKIIVGVYDNKHPIKRNKTSVRDNTPTLFSDHLPLSGTPSHQSTNLIADSHSAPYYPASNEQAKLKADVEELKVSIQKLEEMLKFKMDEMRDSIIRNQISEGIKQDSQILEDVEISKKNLSWAEKFLRDRSFSQLLIDDVIQHLKRQKKDILLEKSHILTAIRNFLKDNLPREEIAMENYNFGNIILYTGPTGVGKTISLVKMAAHIAEMRQKSFRFISIDRYKVGADTQLKAYADLLRVNFYPIHKQEEFYKLIKQDETDFTFIDTAGRNPRETIYHQELYEWIKKTGKKIDIHLVLSATTKPQDLEDTVEKYSILNYNHILATKLDETRHYGSILSAVYKSKKPFSFVTMGQQVPQDFEIANIDKIIADSIK